MRWASLLAVLTLGACSGPANVAEEYVSAPKVYTVVDPDDPHVVLENGERIGVEGAQAGQQIDLGSVLVEKKKKVDDGAARK